MKINKIFYLAFASLLTVSCADLDTAPEGSTVTADQKASVVENNPDRVSASVAGITSMFSVYQNVAETHDDFGYPSIMLSLDCHGLDLVGIDVGYNWFSWGFDFVDRGYTARTTRVIWTTLYNQIYSANSVISIIDAETKDSKLQFYLAQALAVRAFDYFNLAQCYQFTYKGNEDAPCVPLILNTNAEEAASQGIARNTVKDVYARIKQDLDDAVKLLEATEMSRPDKRYVSLDVAYGLRARVELVMQDWAAAAEDAQKAINSSKSKPASIEDVSKPTFKDITETDWMWGVLIAETDRVVTSGIVNWPSHMGSLNYGYASVGAWRRINSSLYDEIPASDIRKGWFLGPDKTSPNLSAEQQSYVTNTAKCPAYTQVKFAPYGDEIYTGTNANDIPLMRVEEMYLILAEAQAMGGNPSAGKATLEGFVQTYRDASYKVYGSTAEEVQNAVWMQRRIELWGEGQSYFDLMRLRKGINRVSTGWAKMDDAMKAYNYNIEDNVADEREAIELVKSGNGGVTGKAINALIFMIPNAEIEANAMLTSGDNNLNIPTLEPVNN